MPFSIERNDLATMQVDAIVVAANERLRITGGVGLTVARAAGLEALQAACDDIGSCETGRAVITPGFALPARFIIHVVGPVWAGGTSREKELLRQAYDSALECAAVAGARSVALPLVSAGTYGFPPEVSCSIALEATRAFLQENDVDVHLVLFDRRAVTAGLALYGDIAEYIDDRYVDEHAAFRASRQQSRGAERNFSLSDAFERGVEAFGNLLGSRRRPEARDGVEERRAASADVPAFQPDVDEEPWPEEPISYGDLEPDEGRAPYDDSSWYGEQAGYGDSAFGSSAWYGESTGYDDAAHDGSLWFDEQAGYGDSAFGGEESASCASAPSPSVTESFAPVPAAPMAPPKPAMHGSPSSARLSEWLDAIDEPFSTTLLKLIDARGMTDAQVYKRANMSRQLFSKIRSDAAYRPTKKTALALAIALQLNLNETSDLLRRAGFALSNSSKADLIVEYHIAHGTYDIFAINEALYAFDQPLL